MVRANTSRLHSCWYKLKIIEQAGQISTQDKTLPKNTIKCYVGFGGC